MHATRRCLQSVQRIISIPITRPQATSHALDHSKLLTYYQFQIHDSLAVHQSLKASEGTWVKWMQDKATSTWSSWGKEPEGSVKLRVHRAGLRVMDRIDFEEIALQGVDPALGPTILHPDISGKRKEDAKLDGHSAGKASIPLLYPPSIYSSETALENLRQLVSLREPRHRRGLWTWVAVTPITFPLKFIPIIPNLPFFFCVWRAWSHYRAYRASQYLSKLIDQGMIVPEASPTLDAIYNSVPSRLISSDIETLFEKDDVSAFTSGFGLKQSSIADLYRALEQAHSRFKYA